jgi:DNA-binding XRE family transcriptional regulator
LRITRSERLFIERRRLGESQEQAAWRHGISLNIYEQMERGQRAIPNDLMPRIGDSEVHERCVVLRRRAQLTQDDVAQSVGCSVRWIQLMERGERPCALLREFWGE